MFYGYRYRLNTTFNITKPIFYEVRTNEGRDQGLVTDTAKAAYAKSAQVKKVEWPPRTTDREREDHKGRKPTEARQPQ